jgi:hypothetical protein
MGKDIQEIQAKIKPVLGQKAWGVSLGHGSFITLNFGKVRKFLLKEKEGENSIGEWHLWVYNCAWRLEKDNDVLAASEDSRSKLEIAIQILEGLAIHSINIFEPAWDATFTFEQNVTLRLFSLYSEEYEHWILYMPDEQVFVFGPGTEWSCVKEDES